MTDTKHLMKAVEPEKTRVLGTCIQCGQIKTQSIFYNRNSIQTKTIGGGKT